jgi:hypothetical protein
MECIECNGTGKVCYSCCGDDIKGNDFDLCPTCKEHCSLEEERCESCDGTGQKVEVVKSKRVFIPFYEDTDGHGNCFTDADPGL